MCFHSLYGAILEKIRILHCLETVGSGGVEQRRLSLAKYLDHEKYQQALVCTKAVGTIPTQLKEANCKVYTVGTLNGVFDLQVYKRVLKIIKEYKPHIIHGAVFEGVLMASICGAISRTPIIICEETSDPRNRSWKATFLLKILSFFTHKMVGVSPASYSYLTNHVSREKAMLINNGVEQTLASEDSLISSLREKLQITTNSFVIGFVGRLLDDTKRISDLITSFSIIAKKYPEARLLIVGDGPDRKKLVELVGTLDIVTKVSFVGYQEKVRPYYDIMNVFVLPSVREAFGLVLVEAMYAKLPIIATNVGGIPHIVEDGKSGFLFEPSDTISLACKIQYFIEHPCVASLMGEKGYNLAVDNFTAERYVKDVDKLYQCMLDERKSLL